MPRQATKAYGNRYFEARLNAAKYNAEFSIRRTAVDYLPGVTEDCLKKYELGLSNPPNSVVALMADAYNAPELLSWYCANECPLGTKCREPEPAPAERYLIRLQNELPALENAMATISRIMDDGKIREDEEQDFARAKGTFLEVYRRVSELMNILDKADKTKCFTEERSEKP